LVGEFLGKREVGFAELRAGRKGGSEKRAGSGIDKTDSGFDGFDTEVNQCRSGEECLECAEGENKWI